MCTHALKMLSVLWHSTKDFLSSSISIGIQYNKQHTHLVKCSRFLCKPPHLLFPVHLQVLTPTSTHTQNMLCELRFRARHSTPLRIIDLSCSAMTGRRGTWISAVWTYPTYWKHVLRWISKYLWEIIPAPHISLNKFISSSHLRSHSGLHNSFILYVFRSRPIQPCLSPLLLPYFCNWILYVDDLSPSTIPVTEISVNK